MLNASGRKFKDESTRYAGYDYRSSGNYFITICTGDRIMYFGKIKFGGMILSDYGRIADDLWKEIPDHFHNIKLDQYVIMPDHIHGINVIDEPVGTLGAAVTSDS